ncbi:MAG TPA: response regulator [Myxococcales bacterium]|nr:response regulator [Myxococcales bacterium]
MPKRILLIDSDETFTKGLAAAATAAGFKTSTASDSEQGMALARQDNPDLIVVCVEAQPTNGYMLCTRLKKDDRLKQIPVILTSANATPDSFEKHKKLKTRAEDYLIKPFAPQAMLRKAAELLGTPAPGDGESAVATDDESLGLGDLVEGEDEPIQLGESEVAEARSGEEEAIDVEELEELVEIEEEPEPAAERTSGDEDLAMFDQAFDALKPSNGAAPAGVAKSPPRRPLDTKARSPAPAWTAPVAPGGEETLGPTDDAELLIEPEPAAAKAGAAPEGELRKLKAELAERDAAVKTAQQRADSLAAAAKKFERELTAAREEAKVGSKAEVAKLQAELSKAREEIAELTGERDLSREERDQLQQKLAQAQAAAKQNEDRAIKAYQKLKGDEKLKEKTRKALQIALALLDDVTIESADEGDKDSA